MKWFYNLRIGTKLISSFVLVSLLAGVVGAVGVVELRNATANFSQLFVVYGVAIDDVSELNTAYQDNRSAVRDVFIDRGKNRQQYVDKIKANDKAFDEALVKVEKNIQTDKGREVFAAITQNIAKYKPIRDKAVEMAMANQEDQAVEMFRSEANPIGSVIQSSIKELNTLKVDTGLSRSDELNKNANRTMLILMSIVAIAILLAIALGIFISRIVSKPIKELVDVAEKIADGNLDVAVEVKTKDEVGILSSAFKRMTDNLNEVMTNINTAAEQVASGSRQVSASSMALSQGATEQASSIEELTASIEEISSQTNLNAENVKQLNVLAEVIQDNSVQGNSQMKEMLTAMEEINDSSNSISKIIKVIDEIAFQTNILALNAAVEAARAGQHGKGFAVVAEEVRNLAARSANAAKETTDMIEGSIKKVEGGTKIANETATALAKIVDGVSKAGVLVNDIAVASSEQATGIAQVTQGIAQVSQVVQTNSATSEESAAASEELSSQAELMREQVSRFTLRRAGNSTYGGAERISPEVLRMLESMSERKRLSKDFQGQAFAEAAVTKEKPRIALSDNEFGKY